MYVKHLDKNDIEQLIQDDRNWSNPIRPQDKDELFFFSGQHPYAALRSLDTKCARAVLDGHGFVLVTFGLVDCEDGTQMGWLVGTERGQKVGPRLHRLHRDFLREEGAEVVKAFTNNMDLDRWHTALGFELTTLWETESGTRFKEYTKVTQWDKSS